ncbi:phosphorylase [Chlorogloeopsis sp. ULAP01]|uniref:ATP adenylyltransferase family protein n=1 Tax=Chlorogloeopsis sp. ULAP01 TaxID=3056483 RepID=UPI0025AA851E|nr:phosphorylase [Chlorogloeopsis sp. ULAP01]MDM9382750.1 phosphorylase [Chlorogloeopsis sp. ULAP01]
MVEGKILLKPGTLWTKVKEQTKYALSSGALIPIPTESEFIEQDGVCFLVRILSNLVRKDEAKQKQQKQSTSSSKDFNPFLPYEEDLFVADISDTHVCILNKYNVADYHLLLITRAFEEQENWLNLQDFVAMWACMTEFDGLTFYNAGKMAGASQRHKHLQIVPLPLVPKGPQIPIEPLLTSAQFQNSIATIPGLPFLHAFAFLDSCLGQSLFSTAEKTLLCYHSLLKAVGLEVGEGNRQAGAYNLLVTRKWMLVVRRSQEYFESIPVNSLGFAGTLFVRNEEQMQFLKQHGPMTILKNVAVRSLNG